MRKYFISTHLAKLRNLIIASIGVYTNKISYVFADRSIKLI